MTGAGDIHRIKHVVVIMQENRSFDTYFGTYPGADGIPMRNRVPTVCVPDPQTKTCVKPFHDAKDQNFGGPHHADAALADLDGGKFDGFIAQSIKGMAYECRQSSHNPACGATGADAQEVMGWHDPREIPNYWTYAKGLRPPGPHVRAELGCGASQRTCSRSRHGPPTARTPTIRCHARAI